MGGRITVFGTSHRLQGIENVPWAIDDPMYLVALKNCLRRKDFIFEEASGRVPTTAQGLAVAKFGQGHYLDVDPSIEERQQLGIGQTELPTFYRPVRFKLRSHRPAVLRRAREEGNHLASQDTRANVR